MANPVERLTSEWQLAPAAALSDLPYTGMAVMRWTCRTALRREFVSRVDAESLERHFGAKAVIRVECHDIYPNCPRYVPGFATGKASIYVPRPDRMPPAPEWKQLPAVAPLLPGNDQQGPTNDSAKG
jgi:hypothetical protein